MVITGYRSCEALVRGERGGGEGGGGKKDRRRVDIELPGKWMVGLSGLKMAW